MKETKFAERVTQINESSTLALNHRAKELRAKGLDIISFGAGEPKFKMPEHIKNSAINAIEEGKVCYTAAGGIPELRNAVAERYNKMHGSNYKKENCIITCGAKHGLFNIAFSLFESGDEIIVPVPYWVSYPEIFKMVGAKMIPLTLSFEENMVLTAEKIKKVLTPKTKAILINTPNNPSGAVIPREELERIAALAVEKNLYIIFDECYEMFVYEGEPHVSLASFDEEVRKRTLLVNSASKTYGLTGLRIGYITGPSDIISIMDRIQGHQTSNPCSTSQYTVLDAIKGNQDFLKTLLDQYRERAQYMYQELSSIEGIRVFKPRGAFYIFPEIKGLLKRGGYESVPQFVEDLIEKVHVSAVPGDGFGMEGYLRFSFVDDIKMVKKGVERFKKFAEEI